MDLASLLAEFDHEMASTRRVLQRVPGDRFDWSPHARSMTLGRLANHVANVPSWGSMTFATPSIDFASAPPEPHLSMDELVAAFDARVVACRAAFEQATAAAWGEQWTATMNGHPVISMPRAAVVRSMILNHLVHHRGQLTVYLRLLDVPVPGVYGPSADER